jgi:hypothetical protein
MSTEFIATLVSNLARTIQRKDMRVWQARCRVSEIQIDQATDFAVVRIDTRVFDAQSGTFGLNHDPGSKWWACPGNGGRDK